MEWELFFEENGIDTLANKKHTHDDEVEIIHVLSGRGSFLVGDSLYEIQPQSVFIIDSNVLHYSSPLEDVPYIRNKLILPKKRLISLFELCSEDYKILLQSSGYLTKTESDRLSTLFFELSQTPGNGFIGMKTICQIFDLCLFAGKERDRLPSTVDQVLKYIHQNLSDPLDIETIAETVHLSSYRLCHVFKEKTGFSIMEYVRLQRVIRAKTLLESTDKSVSDIAIACGYDNFSYFSRLFKEICGKSPREYRKMNMGKK